MMDPPSSAATARRPRWRDAPLVKVLAAQAIGGTAAFIGAIGVAMAMGKPVPLVAMLLGGGLIAALVGRRFFGLPPWWLPVQIVLPPAAAGATVLAVPAWIYLVLFAALVIVYWNSARGRVPLYLSNRKTWREVAKILPTATAGNPGPAVADLGSGFAGMLLHLAAERPDATFAGLETAPVPFAVSWLRRTLSGRRNLTISYADFWKTDLGAHDVIYCFLSPAPMAALYEKAKSEMKPGSLFISNSFAVPGALPDQTILVGDRRKTHLYVWRMT